MSATWTDAGRGAGAAPRIQKPVTSTRIDRLVRFIPPSLGRNDPAQISGQIFQRPHTIPFKCSWQSWYELVRRTPNSLSERKAFSREHVEAAAGWIAATDALHLVFPPSVSGCCYQAIRMALPPLHLELPRSGGIARGARPRRLIRNHPALGAKIRGRIRMATSTAASAAKFKVASGRDGYQNPWLAELIAGKPIKVAAMALANKLARVAWALLRDGGTYQTPTAAAA